MFNLGTGPRKFEPKRGTYHEDESVNDNKVGEVLSIPMQGSLIAHLIDVVVLLDIQAVLYSIHFSRARGLNWLRDVDFLLGEIFTRYIS